MRVRKCVSMFRVVENSKAAISFQLTRNNVVLQNRGRITFADMISLSALSFSVSHFISTLLRKPGWQVSSHVPSIRDSSGRQVENEKKKKTKIWIRTNLKGNLHKLKTLKNRNGRLVAMKLQNDCSYVSLIICRLLTINTSP